MDQLVNLSVPYALRLLKVWTKCIIIRKCHVTNMEKTFAKTIINRHVRQVHDVCDLRTCEHCGSVFTNERKFNAHVKIHTEVRKKKKQDG